MIRRIISSLTVFTAMSAINVALADLATDPSQKLLDKLAVASSEAEANSLYEDVIAAWIDSGGPTVDILMERGMDAHLANDLTLARDMYDRIILIEPNIAEAWYRRGIVFYSEDRYDEAILDFEKAIELEPRHFEAWHGLATIFEGIDEREAALKAYRKVQTFYPHSPYAAKGVKRLKPLVEGRSL